MSCSRVADHINAHLDEDLEACLDEALLAHIRRCPTCQDRTTAERRLRETLARVPVQGPSPGFFDRALAAAASESSSDQRLQWWAKGFGSAIAAGLAVWVAWGLLIQQPDVEPTALVDVSMTLHETQTVNLVFASAQQLDDAVLTVQLPPGVEIAGLGPRDEVRWRTSLKPGKNVLPLELVAVERTGGELLARLEHGDRQRAFKVQVNVT